MADYTITLTPGTRNMASEGSLDTAISGGLSIQRTGYIEVAVSGGKRKIVLLNDGEEFSDAEAHTITSMPGVTIAAS
jgi:hypothetical protein